MTKHESILTDMKAIIDTVPRVSKTSFSKHVPLDQENSWAAVYILPGGDTYEPNNLNTGISGYHDMFYVRVIVNEDNTDRDLLWCDTRDGIIQAVLKDNAIWPHTIDRDIVSTVYDDMNNYPKMTFEMLFQFKIKEVCT